MYWWAMAYDFNFRILKGHLYPFSDIKRVLGLMGLRTSHVAPGQPIGLCLQSNREPLKDTFSGGQTYENYVLQHSILVAVD